MKFPKIQHLRYDRRGDTLVEVLISIAIVSAVLVGSFVVTQQSTVSVRNGQEHSEVLQILQGQVEHVRAMALAQKSTDGGIFTDGGFCIAQTGSGDYVRVDDTDSRCHNIQNLYDVSISYNDTNDVFTFNGNWEGLRGAASNEQLSYRVYSGAPVAATKQATQPPSTVDAGAQKPPSGPSCRASNPWLTPKCWYAKSLNISSNPIGLVVSCTWDWGDGAIITYPVTAPECKLGNYAYHQYVPLPTEPNVQLYKVTVTNTASNGTFRTSSPPLKVYVPF